MAEINIDSCKKEMLVDIIGILYRKFKERFPNELINFTEVKHGEWEVLESFSDPLDDSHKDRCRCTNCGFIHVFTDFHYGQYNFCPNCGARMVKHEHNLS